MAITPVSGVEGAGAATDNGQAKFDAALDNAQGNELPPNFEEIMIDGAITVGGPMIMMQHANNILNEAMSDE